MEVAEQVEIIEPGGKIRFVTLPLEKGIVNIGSGKENDLVIASPDVPAFYAVLDCRQKPYHITFLQPGPEVKVRGVALPTDQPSELNPWDQLEMAGYQIILLEPIPSLPPAAGKGKGKPKGAGQSVPQRVVLPSGKAATFTERLDDCVLAELTPREATASVGEQVRFQVSITNGGTIEAEFAVRVEGLDPAWVTVAPARISLHDGSKGSVSIIVSARREPMSYAGPHPFAVVVTSKDYPDRVSRLAGTLTLQPYYEFTVGELSPRQLTVPWWDRAGDTSLTITNKSNTDTAFRVAAEDEAKRCRFEFRLPGEAAGMIGQGEFRLPAGEVSTIPIRVMPVRRKVIALRSPVRAFTVSAALAEVEQAPRTVMGGVRFIPLIGPWLLLLAALLVSAALVWWLKPPAILALSAAPDRVTRPGDPIVLTYEAKRFGSQEAADEATTSGLMDAELAWFSNRVNAFFTQPVLEYRPADGQWQEIKSNWDTGAKRGVTSHTVPDPGRWQYRLRSSNLLSAVFPAFQAVSLSRSVLVGEVPARIISFSSAPTATVTSGDVLTVSWNVSDADSLVLQHEGLEDVFKDDELKAGQRTFTPDKDTTYTLIALNKTAPDAPDKRNISVKVVPRPIPAPQVVEFTVAPSTITSGQAVTLTWEVLGANKVSLKRANLVIADDVPPRGILPDQPLASTLYQLVASRIESDGRHSEAVTASYSVTVNLPPTPTSVPLTPNILFDLSPKEVVAGKNEQVKLVWVVDGPTTDIEIPELNLTNLKPSDTMSVTVNTTRMFVLIAHNGEKKSSKAVEVKAVQPTPTTTPTPKPTATPVPTSPPPPPVIVYFSAEGTSSAAPVKYDGVLTTLYNMPTYSLEAGSNVNLKWSTANSLKAVLKEVGDQPAEGSFLLFQVSQDVGYTLVAESATGVQTEPVKIWLHVTAFDLPAPTRLTGRQWLDKDNPNVLYWDYDVGKRAKLVGYRIYRAQVGPNAPSAEKDFRAVAFIDNPNTTEWKDTNSITMGENAAPRNPPGCGLGYFVRGVYLDPTNNNATTETLSSDPGWFSAACE